MELIGAELVAVDAGYCEIRLPFREDLTQQHGFFHAGVVGTLADNTAGYAGYSLMQENASVLTVEFKLNLLAPGKGEALVAKANVLKSGRTLTVCRCDVYAVSEGQEKLCAAAQVTLIQLENTSDQ
ncbi:PaaI family thioesterase [Aureisphaera galaxeae]|uniref:PaaI family thioesterase n=1 Tax=Aureisphaera galaxeae TaxID=1538023 RepID=UPI00234FF657|nr:PaaI family thioesterase [Aureisphaera galaxeae]MDC8003705.1 PaaI family thioesterase [Aureisphaera galaxeae]